MPRGQHGKGYNTAKATPQHNATIPKEVPLSPKKRNKVPDVQTKGVRWYVCTTAPQQELRAAESLRRIKLDPPLLAYVPCEFEWKRMKRANLKMPLREFQRPRMRHYLFVGVTGGMTDEVLAAMRERDVEGRNVHRLVGILGAGNGKPLRLNDCGREWIAGLAEAESSGLANVTGASLGINDAVRLTGGPFSMFTARLVAIDSDKSEAVVELSLMGRGTEIRIGLEDLEKVA
ncbi:transcription termination/antitermination protein NusG [Methylobacterium brachythecii]|uniref:Transcriptional antiterminator NusG n=1 Tax=Methylobacterium brachythecii TaxID=1176177 RepID=A0A7W6AKA4_9HYPH|nr:transcription termination/antitermination NusG family protein [Methylobacterium brachythecii]MBB3904213.1 transcriptional antiterminator NusG [Methylobacterium brachythecii]GLS45125.1 hypothetical protein GCM10007884_31140 [Methylobacterium brachythecii]